MWDTFSSILVHVKWHDSWMQTRIDQYSVKKYFADRLNLECRTRAKTHATFLKTTRISNSTTKIDFWLNKSAPPNFPRLREGYRGRLIDNGFGFAHWHIFFIFTWNFYSTTPISPPVRRIQRRKIARRGKRAEFGRTRRVRTRGRGKRGGGRGGASERPRGKMVLSARDEIWIVCYNLRVTYAARFWEASARTREVFQLRRNTIGI